jgi:hypothetical protein
VKEGAQYEVDIEVISFTYLLEVDELTSCLEYIRVTSSPSSETNEVNFQHFVITSNVHFHKKIKSVFNTGHFVVLAPQDECGNDNEY